MTVKIYVLEKKFKMRYTKIICKVQVQWM